MEEIFTLSPHALLFTRLAFSGFFAILFIQSGFDKVMNFRENLSWLVGHFSQTFLSGLVPIMLVLITISEVLAGLTSAYGIIELIIHKSHVVAFWGASFAALSLLFLFFGQRIAKDYGGAAGLVTYFIAAVLAMLLSGY